MPTWNDIQKKRRDADDRLRAEEQRRAQADRLAAAASPPKYDGSRCNYDGRLKDVCCPMGTFGCSLNHNASDPTPPEVLAARRAAWEESRRRNHFTGD